jgi:DNA mismatch repair protein MutS
MADKSPIPDLTPMMEQYLAIKARHEDKILLYRMGDFYETFLEDARTISRILGITLTKRANGKAAEVPLAGFPYHALENYLPRLLQAGHKVAICEQVEDPRQAKGVVKREVVEIVSPGTTMHERVLDQQSNNYLIGVYQYRQKFAFAAVDISTGDFICSEVEAGRIEAMLAIYNPREVIYSKDQAAEIEAMLEPLQVSALTGKDEWLFTHTFAEDTLLKHFRVTSLKSFGLHEYPLAAIAAGVVLHYLQENFLRDLPHLIRLRYLQFDGFMLLDPSTRRNLELTTGMQSQGPEGSLLAILDSTQTPMGRRLLRQIIQRPLLDAGQINARLDAVQSLFGEKDSLTWLANKLAEIGDLERWLGRLSTGRANARDLNGMQRALAVLPDLSSLLEAYDASLIMEQCQAISGLEEIGEMIAAAITDDPAPTLREGNIIRPGYSRELDELRQLAADGKQWLSNFVHNERQATGISSLKVGYNKVFGYYIDVTKTHLEKVPESYIRKQTLVNSERYITPELKEYEEKIVGAEERSFALEFELFQQLRELILRRAGDLQEAAAAIAMIDVLTTFAGQAAANKYTRPLVHNGDELYILNGRHPVVESNLPAAEDFVANDVHIDPATDQIMIITGPNMAGKSTYLRMTGLIVLLAQIGSFVPADEVRLGVVDRVFTRVGASDNLASGESTFMVEMNETAYILNHATPKSLILLDEIGRGTSTSDGLSIAWAVTEYLHNQPNCAAKTMFATHYHELIQLEELYPRIRNFNIAVREIDGRVVFMHKIVPGGTDDSYGIYVGQMAGLPQAVIERAQSILQTLENPGPGKSGRKKDKITPINQLDMFSSSKQVNTELYKALENITIEQTTPLEALKHLARLKQIVATSKSN